MRIDSLAYRLLWRLKRIFYYSDQCGPRPLQLHDPSRHYSPPPSAGIVRDERFAQLHAELQILPRLTAYLPQQLEERDWNLLLGMQSARERFEYLRFLHQREKRRAKDALKEAERKSQWRRMKMGEEAEEEGEEKEEDEREDRMKGRRKDEDEDMEEGCCSSRLLFHPQIRKETRVAAVHRYIRSLQLNETPRVALDCRFLVRPLLTIRRGPLHSRRGAALTFQQLGTLISHNRDRQRPWPLHLVNFPEENGENGPEMTRQRRLNLAALDSPAQLLAEHSQRSYLELFPELRERQRIVYLSPHAPEALERVEPDTCYVIGAIVDRAREPRLPVKASLVTAQAEGLPCRRFPIGAERLRGGNAMFTLDQVLHILQHVFDSPEGPDGRPQWEAAFDRYIPLRKQKSPREKNQLMRLRYENFRIRNREILRVMEEMVKKQMEEEQKEERRRRERESATAYL